jgi:hypothetical protein
MAKRLTTPCTLEVGSREFTLETELDTDAAISLPQVTMRRGCSGRLDSGCSVASGFYTVEPLLVEFAADDARQ